MKQFVALLVVASLFCGCVPQVERVGFQPTLPPTVETGPQAAAVTPIDYKYETRGYENFSLIEKASFYRTVSGVSILAAGLAFGGAFIMFSKDKREESEGDKSLAISLASTGAACLVTSIYSRSLSNAPTFHLETSGFKVTG